MTNTEITAADILEVAQAIIEDPKHWAVGDFQRGERFCAIGAVQEASRRMGVSYKQELKNQAYSLLDRGAGVASGGVTSSAIHLNDGDAIHLNDGDATYTMRPRLPKTRKARHKLVIGMFNHAIMSAKGAFDGR